MPGKKSLQSGKNFEYRVRDLFRKEGFSAQRVPVSGNSEFQAGDIVVKLHNGKTLTLECKRRKEGFKMLYQWLSQNPEKDALIIGALRKEPLIIMPLKTFLSFLKTLTKGGEPD